MERICKNCKYKDTFSQCEHPLLAQPSNDNKDNPFFPPNEDFGCNLFEYKDTKLSFDTQCNLDEDCTSCGS
jgi:hypothetical protein